MEFPSLALFGSTGITYLLLAMLVVVQFIALLMIPAVLRVNVKPEQAARAAYAYLAQSVGIVLMTAGAIPALYAVLTSQPMNAATYTGLLLLFVVGGITFLTHDAMARSIDPASRLAIGAVFFYTWKFLGLVIVLAAVLTFSIRLAMGSGLVDWRWWILHLIFLVYGGLLSWCTAKSHNILTPFQKTTLAGPVVPLQTAKQPAKKPVAKKASKKKA